jgi:hypothetical protein
MNTRGIIIFFAIPVLTVTTLLFINNAAFLGGVEQSRINDIKQQQDAGKTPGSTSNKIPTDTELLQLFFQAIQEKNTSISLGMLDPANFSNDAALKEWEKQFTSFEKAQIMNIEPVNQAGWGINDHVYKITLSVKMLPEAASAPIPNYGWQNGDNIRWVKVRKGADNLWRVLEIATGP